jgi:hypothetical protein
MQRLPQTAGRHGAEHSWGVHQEPSREAKGEGPRAAGHPRYVSAPTAIKGGNLATDLGGHSLNRSPGFPERGRRNYRATAGSVVKALPRGRRNSRYRRLERTCGAAAGYSPDHGRHSRTHEYALRTVESVAHCSHRTSREILGRAFPTSSRRASSSRYRRARCGRGTSPGTRCTGCAASAGRSRTPGCPSSGRTSRRCRRW